MAQLTAAVGKAFSADEIAAWYGLLNDIDDAALEAGFGRACRECEGFPSVALIRRFACDLQHGEQSSIPDVWPKVLEAIRYFGFYGKAGARNAIPANVWKALGGDVGWEHLCEMEADQRTAFAAQFRERYREIREREQRDRRLPEHLRPRIDNTPVRGLPERGLPEPLALPAPDQPTAEQVEAARLRVFRSAEPEPVIDEAAIEANRQRQIDVARRMAGGA
jgi:hypothetical protein